MGWNYRKSVNLGGGMRLNFSKSGIGISGGVKGFRISTGPRGTRMTASIPGTGIYYTKNLSGGKKRGASNSQNTTRTTTANTRSTYQYTQTVTNEYTGETRELRARTQFELNQLVQLEQERQIINEQRQRYLENAQNRQQQVDMMNKQLLLVRDEFNKIITHTLSVNDRIDLDKQLITDEFPPLQFTEKAPVQKTKYRLGFFKSLFINEKKFELPDLETDEMRAYEARRNEAIADYLKKKAAFDSEKNRKNGELTYLRRRFEESDKDAVERYVSIVLTNSKYPVDFEHDFEVVYDREKKKIVVNFLFQDIDSFPITEKYDYNRETDEIEEVIMKREVALAFYSDILYSVGIRTMHEVFESVYTDGLETVVFNGYIEDEEDGQCAFAMRSTKVNFEKIDLKQSLGKIISMVESRTIGDFTKRDQIAPFE